MPRKLHVPFSILVTVLLALMAVSPALGHDPDPVEPLLGLDSDAGTQEAAGASGAHSHNSSNLHSQNMHHLVNIPSLGPTNSDLAFWGNLAFAGNYGGFRVIDISDPEAPVVVANVICPGPQNDISVWGHILILSIDQVRTSPACDSAVANPQTLETGWEGIRIFDVSDPASPRYVTSVYTDCGSHTHTTIPDLAKNRLLVYVASYPLRSGPDCGPHDDPTDTHDPLHKKISIVEIPLNNPAAAHVLATPAIDVKTFDLLVPFGFNPMQGCHDIQVNLALGLVAAACGSVGELWDISAGPANPQTLSPLWEVDEPEVQFYHSALFSEGGDTVIFGDEIIFGSCDDGTGSGQLWFYNRMTGARQSSFQIPRPQPGQYCSSHLFNNIPGVRGDVLVASWYNGGTTIVDYTNRSAPREIGYFDPADGLVWSSYWYNNFIYANDIVRGVDVFLLSDRARAGALRLDYLNPQTQ
ncbi:MAG TPA: hypothetical protein VJ793_15800 [Anaerolineae bacterium]|nr:hypothetical protein [Anaerolineae bacterium]